MRRVGSAAAAVGVLVLLAAHPSAAQVEEGTFERELKVTGPVDLSVSTGSGDITVRQGKAGAVRVVGRIRASDRWRTRSRLSAAERVRRLIEAPPIVQNGNVVRVGEIDDPDLRDGVSISYELTVPASTRLRSRSGSGSQSIDGIDGPVDASSGSGNLRIGAVGGEVRATAGSGSIAVEGVKGTLHASTGSGNLVAADVAGAVSVSTGSGRVEVEQTAPGDARVRTGSGSIILRGVNGGLDVSAGSGRIEVEGRPVRDWRLRAASGSVTLRLVGEPGFELRARTSSGGLSTTHPVTVIGAVGRREIRGTVRGGGPLIDISTASGSIRIE
ncbi:MAG TPA: DUF4097 family beta strand repeat-containing protein [Vicinamibacterales bacterium]|nr:DUF4097 family beta strand repeat-containing protein [Vicinamibacterales bacterium]